VAPQALGPDQYGVCDAGSRVEFQGKLENVILGDGLWSQKHEAFLADINKPSKDIARLPVNHLDDFRDLHTVVTTHFLK
jgi:hypothetical protein